MIYVLVLCFFFHPLKGSLDGMVMTKSVTAQSEVDCQASIPGIIKDELGKYKPGSIDSLRAKCIQFSKEII